jgi:hypothetical protein
MTVLGRAEPILGKVQKSFFAIFYEKPKNNFWTFRKIDAARPKTVIESSAMSHFKLSKQNFFASSEC